MTNASGSSRRLERRLENRAHDQEQDEAHDPQDRLAQILDQKRDERAERRPDDHRARIPEAAKAHRDKPGQHKGHKKLDEAVEAKVAGPGEQGRVDRRGDRIDRWRCGGERRPGGEIDHRPQDRQRQDANGHEDHHQPLQRRVAAFMRICADARGQGDQLRGRGGRSAEPAECLAPRLSPWFPSARGDLARASAHVALAITQRTRNGDVAFAWLNAVTGSPTRGHEGERDHKQRKARRRPLPQIPIGPLEHGPERE